MFSCVDRDADLWSWALDDSSESTRSQRIGRTDDSGDEQLWSITDSDAPYAPAPDCCAPRSPRDGRHGSEGHTARRHTYDDINLNSSLLTPIIQGQARSLKLRLSSQFPVNALADTLM